MTQQAHSSLPAERPAVSDAAARWHALLPREAAALCRVETLEELLRLSARARQDGQEALQELRQLAYDVARMLEERLGHQATLHYLRDGLSRALGDGETSLCSGTEHAGRIVAAVSDAAWEARTDILEAAIQRHQADRMRQELMLAKRIQERLLPRAVPSIPGFDIAGRVQPAAEVGGDYWSCKWYDEEGVVTLKLADVTGHGLAAATLVAAVKFISGGYFRGAASAAEVMDRTNRVLVKETPHEILVTMVYGWLRPQAATLSVVNAGHSPVLVYRAATGTCLEIGTTGLALGMVETHYTEATLHMEPGDIFFTCSDGITAPGADRALGEEWVARRLADLAHLPAGELVDRLILEASSFYGRLRDDMSALAVKRLPTATADAP